MEKVTVGLEFEGSDCGRQIGGSTFPDKQQYKNGVAEACLVCLKKMSRTVLLDRANIS